jgi:hypothetical protein
MVGLLHYVPRGAFVRRTPMFLAAIAASVVCAMAAGPAVASKTPPYAKAAHGAFGQSLGGWIGAWWQHYLALPISENPLAGNGSRCGAVGKVLMPVYGPGFDAECTVKPGTFVLLNVWSGECSNVEPPPFFGADEAQLRACVRTLLFDDPPDEMSVSVDGRRVADVEDSRGLSSSFSVELPENNLLGVPATSAMSVAGGWAVLLRPLPPGTHELEVCLLDPDVGPFNGCSTTTLHVAPGARGATAAMSTQPRGRRVG